MKFWHAALPLGALVALVLGPILGATMHSPSPAAGSPAAASSSAPPSTNRLAGQASRYLRQHQHNPVDWYPWGDEALARARELDRPIFLSIGYASCHWCHVMEAEVFEDAEVARMLNRDFVAIKVDREERPDLDAVYMQAVQALTGRGGWPLSVFLTPSLQPFHGGTYFPRPAFLQLLARIRAAFADQRAGIERDARKLAELVSAEQAVEPLAVDESVRAAAIQQLLGLHDGRWGGLRGRQKFPTPVRWRLALLRLRRQADPELAAALRLTLDQMAAGGIRDHLAGGFHRYTVEPTWTVPHFEKMLYDNAQLASLYAEAAVLFDAPRYAEVALDTLDFMLRDLRGEEGSFYASLDADSGGEEGSYYVWTSAELGAIAGEDGPRLAALLGVSAKGNFEGSSVLTRRALAEPDRLHPRLDDGAARELWARWREPLLQARAERVAPGLDRKVVTAWNGLALGALARGYSISGERRYLEAALAAADHLRRLHRRDDGGLWRASTAGRVAGAGILDDQAMLAGGLLDLFAVSQDIEHLRWALELIDHARSSFAHPEGGFYLSAAGAEAPLGRSVELFDGVEPSGNAAMLQAMLQAAALTGRAELLDEVDRALTSQGGLLRRAGLELAAWLAAAELRAGPYYELVVSGEPAAADTRALLQVARELLPAHSVTVQVAAGGASAELLELLPPVAGKRAQQGRATAYLCERGSCQKPTADPGELRRQLQAGWGRQGEPGGP